MPATTNLDATLRRAITLLPLRSSGVLRGVLAASLAVLTAHGAQPGGAGYVQPPPAPPPAAPPPACYWTLQTVDALGVAGICSSLAFGPDGRPAIAHVRIADGTWGATGLAISRLTAGAWSTTVLHDSGAAFGPTSLAFGPDGQPAVAWRDVTGAFEEVALRFARFNGTSWVSETVDATDDAGLGASVGFASNGDPVISYLTFTDELRFARRQGGTWDLEVLDTGTASATSLAIAPDGHPAIAYGLAGNGPMIRYARYTGSGWVYSDVSTVGGSIDGISLAFAPDGTPAIAYSYGRAPLMIRFVRVHQGVWLDSSLGRHPTEGTFPSLAFGPDGQPAIAYLRLGDGGSLTWAQFHGLTWSHTVLDAGPGTGAWASLAFAPDGRPAIACHDYANDDLRFARCNPVLAIPGLRQP